MTQYIIREDNIIRGVFSEREDAEQALKEHFEKGMIEEVSEEMELGEIP